MASNRAAKKPNVLDWRGLGIVGNGLVYVLCGDKSTKSLTPLKAKSLIYP